MWRKVMTRKKAVVSNLILVLLFIQTFASFSTAQASGTGISVNPSSLTASMGDNITITITAGNVTNLYGWQAAIKYNASIINCTGVWLPADNVFAGLSQIPVPPILNDPTNDGLNYVLWGVSLFSGAVSFVQGTLFKLNFTVVGYGETVIQIGTKQNPIQYNPGFPQTWYTYLQDPDLNEIPFIEENGNVVVRATKAQVTFTQTGVGSDFAGTVVGIDGVNHTRGSLPFSFMWDIGSNHSFAYQSPLIVTANAKRYVWNSTSGPVPLQSGSINVTAPQTVAGNYKTQYYLAVNSTYDSPNPASGWCEENVSVAASVSSVVSGPAGTRYVCTGWTGTGSVPSGGGGSSFSFVINQSSSIIWNWKTQYLLTVSTSPDGLNPQPTRTPQGENASANSWWYDSSVGVALSAQAVDGYAFTHWGVDGVSQGLGTTPVSATMNTTHTVTAYYTSSGAVPDIATVNVTCSKTTVGQGYAVAINVTVENHGVDAESFNLTVYANTTVVAFQTVTLESGNSTTVTIVWNTTGFGIGNYTVSAYAEPVPGETNTADNTFNDGVVNVSIQGDVNGDRRVDMKDIGYIARRFLVPASDPLWDSNADINGDGKIDMKDIGIAAKHFAEHYP
jgi:hypothetical protein